MDNALVWIIAFGTLFGFNFTFWVAVGVVRYFVEQFQGKVYSRIPKTQYTSKDIAVVIPAHNEEKTIDRTLNALLQVIPRKNIYVVSDYSTDRTLSKLLEMGIRTIDLHPGRGKARALIYLMQEYGVLDAYQFVLINDADTEIDRHYIERALPLFNDPEVAAVATHGVTRIEKYNFWQKFFISYRIRLWRVIQIGMRFGQTWKYTNVSYIIPGSLALYRTRVLKQLEVDAPGLLIEDFNMTFEVHKKKLGKIAYQPNIIGFHQDPYTLRDYIRQIKRWNIGFFQTVKRHGFWPSFFWLSTTAVYVEMYIYALFVLLVPFLLFLLILNHLHPITIPYIYERLTIYDLLFGFFFIDYLLTSIAAILERNPTLLFYGIGFVFLRFVDSIVYIVSPWIAFTKNYPGTWKSPERL